MNSFFKMFFASLLAILVAFALPFILFIGFLAAISSTFSSSEVASVKNNTILKINLSKSVVDEVSGSPLDYLDVNTFEVNAPGTTLSYVRAIENAASDPRIEAIFIDGSLGSNISLTTLQEMRNALINFKSAGKKVYSYSNIYSNASYYISSVSDKIVMNPAGELQWFGMSSQIMMYKDILDKLGVDMQIIRVGKYKSAVEPFILSKMSEESKEQTRILLNSVWSSLLADVSKSRNVDVALLQKYADELTLSDASEVLKAKMIDTLMYKDQFVSFMDTLYGKNSNVMSISKYASTLLSMRSTDGNGTAVISSKNKIALLYATGSIVDGVSSNGSIGDVSMNAKIAALREDSLVKAVVLRVNSPGGSALASELMWRELSLLQQKKPLIISMGDYAASGGYYISCMGDAIFADPATITGSIGVFGMIPNAQKTMKLIGVNVETISTNKNSDIYNNIFAPKTSSQLAYFQKHTDNTYELFIKRVSEGRNIPVERVKEIAQGRVYSGVEAKGIGLVDQLGSISDAILFAAQKAGVESDFIVEEPISNDNPFTTALKTLSTSIKSYTQPDFGIFQTQYEHLSTITKGGEIQAIMPYKLDIR